MKELKFDLIKELKLENISDAEKKELIEKYSKSLEDKILGRIIAELTEEQQKELDSLITAGKSEESNDYLIKNVPNIDMLAKEEFEEFKKVVLDANEIILKGIEELKETENPS